jgi:hypothetical protein
MLWRFSRLGRRRAHRLPSATPSEWYVSRTDGFGLARRGIASGSKRKWLRSIYGFWIDCV